MKARNKPARAAPPHQVRIIGGVWRGRRLPVAEAPDLRPSPDRARETLFNWLQPYIEGAVCLDLFAGTGALGFEAASRGASRVVMVEDNPALARGLREQAGRLGAEQVEIVCREALDWLAAAPRQVFDIVFLDPPFARGLIEPAVNGLIDHHCLSGGALVYVESKAGLEGGGIPLQKFKQARAGQVQYELWKFHAIQNP